MARTRACAGGDQRTFPARMCLTRSKTNVASSVLPAQYAAPTKAAPATYYDTASGVPFLGLALRSIACRWLVASHSH
jgi:hypothetical protein